MPWPYCRRELIEALFELERRRDMRHRADEMVRAYCSSNPNVSADEILRLHQEFIDKLSGQKNE
jgi:hypothetical protein